MISLNWVNDYVDLKGVDLKDLALKITKAGVNVESVHSNHIENLVIGKILECENHPDSDHLHVCKVDVKDETLTIVCGASNVHKGQKVIVAKPGAILPGNFEIKKSKIRNVESCGMICALFELGLEEKNEETYAKGIAELPEDAPVGEDPIAYLGLDDTLYELDLNPNRFMDCTNHLGFAYEVAAVLGKKVKKPETTYPEENTSMNDQFSLTVETENCPYYSTKIVTGVTIKESPEFIKRRLEAAGMRSINNVVDISNYIMLEYGQPLHFFDKDTLGDHITVRMAKENEKMITLDGKERELTDQDILITDGENPVCIAGVMGGLESEVTEKTKNILIESAIFDPYHVRYTSLRLDLRSEASLRMEKGLNVDYTKEALDRACYLLCKYAGGKVLKDTIVHDQVLRKEKIVTVSLKEINALLGMTLKEEDVVRSLENLQFPYQKENDQYKVTIPHRRLDVEAQKADIIEEIGRLYGYDHIEAVLPVGQTKPGRYIGNVAIRKQVSKRLRSLGFHECRTYTLISEEEDALFPYDRKECISLLKPMSSDKKILRQTILPSLLNVVSYNSARHVEDIFLYEIANTYYDVSKEDTKVAFVASGKIIESSWQKVNLNVDFYYIKGILENLFCYLGLQNRYSFVPSKQKDMHPYLCVDILLDRKPIGILGKVHPNLSKKDLYICEFSLTEVAEKSIKPLKYKELSKYPTITKDLSFVVKKDTNSEEIEKVIKKAGGRLLTSLHVFDVYTGENVKEDEKSIAYSLTFSDPSRTLTEDEVMVVFHKIIQEVEIKCQATLRDK